MVPLNTGRNRYYRGKPIPENVNVIAEAGPEEVSCAESH